MEETVVARIGRYLAGEMDLPEKTGFEHELETNPELKQEFLVLRRIWQESMAEDPISWDQKAALDRFEKNNPGITMPAPPRRVYLRWAIAASLLFLLVSSYFLFVKAYPQSFRYAEQGSAPVELKDGTTIYLNKGGAVTVHPFRKNSRHVELIGEAFFHVASDPDRPFTISCGQTLTEVAGTSFNLKQNRHEVYLFVQSGKVIFSAPDQEHQALALTAGEAGYYQDKKMHLIPNPTPNHAAWRTKQLWFVNMPLSDVIRDVSAYFEKTIVIEKDDIRSCPIRNTLPYKDPEIISLLRAIARTINAEVVEEENGSFRIKGGNCSR